MPRVDVVLQEDGPPFVVTLAASSKAALAAAKRLLHDAARLRVERDDLRREKAALQRVMDWYGLAAPRRPHGLGRSSRV